MKDKQNVVKGRREFFRVTGLGLGALGAAAVALPSEEAEAATEDQKAGYRESDHVKRYYELAKF